MRRAKVNGWSTGGQAGGWGAEFARRYAKSRTLDTQNFAAKNNFDIAENAVARLPHALSKEERRARRLAAGAAFRDQRWKFIAYAKPRKPCREKAVGYVPRRTPAEWLLHKLVAARCRRLAYKQVKRGYVHSPKEVARNRARKAAKARRHPRWARTPDQQRAIVAAYAEAARRTASTGERHEVDHIYPLRGKTVSGLHVAENLQVVHHAVNAAKHNLHPEVFILS